MKKLDAILYFGTQKKLAAAICVGTTAISNWGEHPPDSRQAQLELLTGGFLKAEKHIPTTENIIERKERRRLFRKAKTTYIRIPHNEKP